MQTEDLLTVKEAATALGIQAPTVYEAIREGRLESQRVLGRVVVTRDALATYRERAQPTGQPQRGRPRKPKDAGEADR